jgi:MFS transporter, FHS family, glucose/mannose:H+ symporter
MDSTPAPSSTANPRFEWFLLHAGFVLIGIITNILAPALPIFSRQWGLSDAQAGFFFTAQFFSSTIGVIATSWMLRRYSFSKVLGAGFLFLTIGMAFLGIGPWMFTATCVAMNGFGYGIANPTTNLRGTQLPSSNVAGAVSLLNFSWGVGAVACPFLVAALAPSCGVRGLAICVAVFTFALCVLHFLQPSSGPTSANSAKRSLADWVARMRQPSALPLLFLFFLYVGTEVGIGGWVAALEKRLPGGSTSALAVAPSVFYASLLIGRGCAPLFLKRFPTLTISFVGLLVVACGAGLIALSTAPAILLVGAAVAGFGCAPQYPVFVTWLAQVFREDSTWLAALFFGAGGLGGSALPWLVGIIAAASHSLRAGFLLPLAASLLMVVLTPRARPQPSFPA